MASINRIRDCCEKVEKGTKYDTDELKSYMRRQKELRRLRAVQEFEERERMLESKKQRLRELDSKCKQLASKKSTSPQQTQANIRPSRPVCQNYPDHHLHPLPHHSRSSEKASPSGTQHSGSKPKSRLKRPKQDSSPPDVHVRKTKSSNLERQAADFIFKEFEQIVRRECQSILRDKGLVTASESSLSTHSGGRDQRSPKVRQEKEKVIKIDKSVGTSFSLYEPPPPQPQIVTRYEGSSSGQSQTSENKVKPVTSSKGCHSLFEELRAMTNENRIKLPRRPVIPDSVKNAAASKIQAAYKGYKIRSILCEANLRSGHSNRRNIHEKFPPESISSDSNLQQRKKMKFFKPHLQTNGFSSTSALLQPEKPYDQKLRLPLSITTRPTPIKPNTDEIPGYIPPPPPTRLTLPQSRAPELSPRTLPLLRMKTVDEPFPKQVLAPQSQPPTQQQQQQQPQPASQNNLISTSSPLKLISSISKFQLPYALQSPCSKEISSSMIRAALRQQAEQASYRAPQPEAAAKAHMDRSPENVKLKIKESSIKSGLRSKPGGIPSNNVFTNLPDPAFSTVLQEKIRMLRGEHKLLPNGNGAAPPPPLPRKSKSPTKRTQMTAVSKATEQIKKKIVEAKQILEEYKLELLRTSPGTMSQGGDTYESDFDSESHQSSLQQNSLYGRDSEILSSFGPVELIPRPPSKEPSTKDERSSKSEVAAEHSAKSTSRKSSKDKYSLTNGHESEVRARQSSRGINEFPEREETERSIGGISKIDHVDRSMVTIRQKPTPPALNLPAEAKVVKSDSTEIRIPSTVTLRRREIIQPTEIPVLPTQKPDEVFQVHFREPPVNVQPAVLTSAKSSEETNGQREDFSEPESEHSKAETETDYEELPPTVSKASSNIATEDMYETDFETEWQSLTQSKPLHHSLIAQKGGIRSEEPEGNNSNTQTSLSLSTTEQKSRSAGIQLEIPSESSSKADQEIQVQPDLLSQTEEIEDEAPSAVSNISDEISDHVSPPKESEAPVGPSPPGTGTNSIVEVEYEGDFITESASKKVGNNVMSTSIALDLVSDAKDSTIVEEFSAVLPSNREDTFISEETPEDKDISGKIVEDYQSVSEASNDVASPEDERRALLDEVSAVPTDKTLAPLVPKPIIPPVEQQPSQTEELSHISEIVPQSNVSDSFITESVKKSVEEPETRLDSRTDKVKAVEKSEVDTSVISEVITTEKSEVDTFEKSENITEEKFEVETAERCAVVVTKKSEVETSEKSDAVPSEKSEIDSSRKSRVIPTEETQVVTTIKSEAIPTEMSEATAEESEVIPTKKSQVSTEKPEAVPSEKSQVSTEKPEAVPSEKSQVPVTISEVIPTDESEVAASVKSPTSELIAAESQTNLFEPDIDETSQEDSQDFANKSHEVSIQVGISEVEPPTPLKQFIAKPAVEDISIQSDISENLPETEVDDDNDEDDQEHSEEDTEEEKDMLELAKIVDSEMIERIESLIASEISDQFERDNEDSEGATTTVEESKNSRNFHVEDVAYESDFDTEVASDKSEKSTGDADLRKSSLLEAAVKREVQLLVNSTRAEEKTGEGDVVSRPLSPVADPRLRKILNDQRTLDLLIGRIISRMFEEVTKARREVWKPVQKPVKSTVVEVEGEEDDSLGPGEGVDGDAEWFEDELMPGTNPEDESLKREAAEIVAEQLRIENEIRALEALQAQVPVTLLNLTETPDKPPPPYSPPSSDSLSISLRSLAVQTTCDELEKLVRAQVDGMWEVWRDTGKVPHPGTETVETTGIDDAAQMSSSDRKDILVSPSGVSKGAFSTLLTDLIHETIKETLLVEDEEGPLARDYVDRIRPGSLALQAQRLRIPRSAEALAQTVLSKVKNLIPYPTLANDVPVPRKRLTKWTSRPRDLVDEVLAEELIDEDREWTECWPEEILVLDRWAEKFARRALHQVNVALRTAFSV